MLVGSAQRRDRAMNYPDAWCLAVPRLPNIRLRVMAYPPHILFWGIVSFALIFKLSVLGEEALRCQAGVAGLDALVRLL